MDSLDETYSLTGYEPNAYDFKETYVASYTELLTSPCRSPSKGFPRTPSTMTPRSRICCVKLTEYMSITLNEEGLVCRSVVVLCPKELGDLLERKRSDLLSQVVRMHRLELCWTDKKSEFLPSAWQKLTDTNFQADYDRRSLRILGEIVESQREELHCAQAEELQRRDQQLLHGQLLQQNLELREAHQKSLNEMEELQKFQSSTFDTIARRRLVEDQDTIFGTYWPNTGIAK